MIKTRTTKLFLLFIVAFAFSSFMKKTKSYTYIDGNNNVYTIRQDSIFYSPIKPQESSSGIYNGGEPAKIKITTEQFAKIEAIIKAIQKDKKSWCDKREMGYGTVVVGKKSIFLNTSSKSKAMLEQELNLLLWGI